MRSKIATIATQRFERMGEKSLIEDIVAHMEQCARSIEKGCTSPKEVAEDIHLWSAQLQQINGGA